MTVIFGSRTYVLDTDENVSISINVGIQDTICPLKMDDHCTGKIEVSVKIILSVKSLALNFINFNKYHSLKRAFQ